MLRQAFEVYGEVTDAFVAYNGRSSRGFGYVTFKEAPGAAEAVRARPPAHCAGGLCPLPAW